jgi:hypothetical protein
VVQIDPVERALFKETGARGFFEQIFSEEKITWIFTRKERICDKPHGLAN